jgi:hypothetical protein
LLEQLRAAGALGGEVNEIGAGHVGLWQLNEGRDGLDQELHRTPRLFPMIRMVLY